MSGGGKMTKVRIIRVVDCSDCLYVGYTGDDVCMFRQENKNLPDFPIIPEWCPLEKEEK